MVKFFVSCTLYNTLVHLHTRPFVLFFFLLLTEVWINNCYIKKGCSLLSYVVRSTDISVQYFLFRILCSLSLQTRLLCMRFFGLDQGGKKKNKSLKNIRKWWRKTRSIVKIFPSGNGVEAHELHTKTLKNRYLTFSDPVSRKSAVFRSNTVVHTAECLHMRQIIYFGLEQDSIFETLAYGELIRSPPVRPNKFSTLM